MTRIHLLFCCTCVTIVLACCGDKAQNDQKIKIRDFYLDADKFKQGLVYVYRPVFAPADAPADFWHQQLMETDSGMYLELRYYDKDTICRQRTLEKITPTGALQKELRILEKDIPTGKLTETTAEIISGAIFPFAVVDTHTMVVYEVKYALPGADGQRVSIRRNRRYGGVGPDFVFQGKEYPTIKMILAEEIGNEGEGNATISGNGEEHYAKGLGRVYYRKSYGNGEISEEYKLVEILSAGEFFQK